MSLYHTRKVTFRLTEDEFEAALRLATYRFRFNISRGTISRLLRSLLAEAIAQHKQREDLELGTSLQERMAKFKKKVKA